MPFLIGISGGFIMYIYAFMKHYTAILHKIWAFQGILLHIMQSGKIFEKIEFLCKMSELYRVVWYSILKPRE